MPSLRLLLGLLCALSTPSVHGAPASSVPYVTGVQFGGQRNDVSGFVGMNVTIGPANVQVTHLGRLVINGNSGTHLVKIVRASDLSDVPAGSATVDTSSANSGNFAYTQLPAAITLLAGQTYYIASQEVAGGDKWFDVDTEVTTSDIAAVNSGIFDSPGFRWSSWGMPNQSYGPVNFKYIPQPTPPPALHVAISSVSGDVYSVPANLAFDVEADPLVTTVEFYQNDALIATDSSAPFKFNANGLPAGIYQFQARGLAAGGLDGLSIPFSLTITPGGRPADEAFIWAGVPGSRRQDFTGELGMKFTVGPMPLTITELGRMSVKDNNRTHRLRLVRALDQVEVANSAVVVNMAGTTEGNYHYAPLPGPITLTPNNAYYLMSEELDGGDKWWDFNGRVTSTDVAVVDGPVFIGNGFPWTEIEAPGRSYGFVNFRYSGNGAPPPAVSITSPAAGATLMEESILITASADADVILVEFFANGTLIGQDNSAPYGINWANPGPGQFTLTARAVDGNGIPGVAAPVSVTIESDEPLPTISLTSPTAGTPLTSPGTTTLEATVTGNATLVEFFVNGTKIGEEAAPPYRVTWSPDPGSFTLTASVTDDLDRTVTSDPVNVTVQIDIGGGGGPHFVIDATLGTPRSSFAGFVGMAIDVGPEPVEVSALGRMHVEGNSGSHLVKIVQAGDGTDMTNGSVVINTSGGVPGTFQYAPLNDILTLEPNTRYFIVSEEMLGGDQWHDLNTVVTTTEIGTVSGAVYHLGGNNWQLALTPNKCYGPLDIRYGNAPPDGPSISVTNPVENTILTDPLGVLLQSEVSAGVTNVEFFANNSSLGNIEMEPWDYNWSNPLPGIYEITARATDANGIIATSDVVNITIESTIPPADDVGFVRTVSGGTVRNDFAGFVGLRFTTGTNELVITALGRLHREGNTETHELKLVRVSDSSTIPGSSVILSMAGGTDGVFRYAPLASPITLPPNTSYYLVSEESSEGDTWLDVDAIVTATDVATIDGAVYAWPNPPWQEIIGPGFFGPVSFRYESDDLFLPTVEISSPSDGSTLTGPPSINVAASSSETVVKVEFFQGTVKLGESTTRPYSIVWTNPLPGNYTLTARATDSSARVVTSSPVSFTVLPGLAPGAEGPFIISTTLGRLRNDFDGFLGMTFTTGPDGVTVTQLGRMRAPGNTGVHLLKLVRQSDGSDLLGGSISVDMTGGAEGEFIYGQLPEELELAPNTIYHLVSQEFLGQDMWHDVSGTTALTDSIATLDSGVFGGPPWTGGGLALETFIPVNFIYRAGEGSTNNAPLEVSLTNPSEGQRFTSPTTISLEAAASAGTVLVEFYEGSNKIGEADSFPYVLGWVDPAPGSYTLMARARNGAGEETDSQTINITVDPAPTGTEMPYISNVTPGDVRNDVTALLGFEFTVGPAPVTVTKLGRYVLPGNNQSHTIKLATEADGIDVPGGSVVVSTAGQTPGTFVYADLPQPIRLQANTIYFIASQETAGGDEWYDLTRTVVEADPVASVDGGVFKFDNWITGGLPNHAYIPVNFQFISTGIPSVPTVSISNPDDGTSILAPATVLIETTTGAGVNKVEFFEGNTKLGEDLTEPFSLFWSNSVPGDYALVARATSVSGLMSTSQVVTVSVITNLAGTDNSFILSHSPGALRHNFDGWVGMKFTVGDSPLTVISLGREYVSGNMMNHRVKLVRALDGTDIPNGMVEISTSGGVIGQHIYTELPQEIILEANTMYYLVSEETIDGDLWYDADTDVMSTAVASVDGGIHSTPTAWELASGEGTSFGTVNFRYRTDDISAPTVSITSPANGATLMSPGTVLIEASVSAGVTNVEFFADSVKLADDTAPPYRFSWVDPAPTNHIITVRATDSSGLASSAQINIIVTGPMPEVPENFVVTSLPSPVTRNNFDGFLGMTFTVGPEPITVTEVGRMAVSGNTGSHQLKFVHQSDGSDLPGASATVSMAGAAAGQFVYAPLPTPVQLQANTIYHFVSEESIDGDLWHDVARTGITTMPVATVDSGVFGNDTFDWNGGGLPNHTYGPLDFKYLGGTPEPVHKLLRIERVGEDIRVILNGMAGSAYRVERSSQLTIWTEVGIYNTDGSDTIVETITPTTGAVYYRVTEQP